MIFGQDRDELRGMFAAAWRKRCAGEVMSPLETQIAQVVANHPEYHDDVTGDLDRDFPVEGGRSNPFLHMALHLGIREQVATDRPAGVREVFERVAAASGNPHDAEHRLIDCLAETLWEAQGRGEAPEDTAYLERLRKLM
jgi:Domain of unknown function (DUF1841)